MVWHATIICGMAPNITLSCSIMKLHVWVQNCLHNFFLVHSLLTNIPCRLSYHILCMTSAKKIPQPNPLAAKKEWMGILHAAGLATVAFANCVYHCEHRMSAPHRQLCGSGQSRPVTIRTVPGRCRRRILQLLNGSHGTRNLVAHMARKYLLFSNLSYFSNFCSSSVWF